MRRVADELGVGTMTLYTYVASKEDLLEAVLELAMSEVAEDQQPGAWREQLQALLTGVRRMLLCHPGVLGLALQQPRAQPRLAVPARRASQILRQAGLPEPEASSASRALIMYTMGCAAFGAIPGPTLDGSASTRTPSRPAARDRRAATRLDPVGDEAFHYGLTGLLDSLQSRLSVEAIRQPVRPEPHLRHPKHAAGRV